MVSNLFKNKSQSTNAIFNDYYTDRFLPIDNQ